ncbi:MAG: aromatic-ring-hydroxylating dioxygenase subunit beta [Brachymonas sp.]|nr:aromatic-ring-hydroxylating dioxygenase subunit beta [Brachymonas sp.]
MEFFTYLQLTELLQRSAALLDSNDLSTWPDLFIPDGRYKLQSRENFDASLPLCIMDYESQGMLRDRIYGVQNTIYHDPYSQRHVCSAPLIGSFTDSEIQCESSYIVTRTQRDGMPQIISTGRYMDVIVRDGDALRFKSRTAVYDNDLLPNSVIKPI